MSLQIAGDPYQVFSMGISAASSLYYIDPNTAQPLEEHFAPYVGQFAFPERLIGISDKNGNWLSLPTNLTLTLTTTGNATSAVCEFPITNCGVNSSMVIPANVKYGKIKLVPNLLCSESAKFTISAPSYPNFNIIPLSLVAHETSGCGGGD